MFKTGDIAIFIPTNKEVTILKSKNKIIRYGGCVYNRGEVSYQKAYTEATIKFDDGRIGTINDINLKKKGD